MPLQNFVTALSHRSKFGTALSHKNMRVYAHTHTQIAIQVYKTYIAIQAYKMVNQTRTCHETFFIILHMHLYHVPHQQLWYVSQHQSHHPTPLTHLHVSHFVIEFNSVQDGIYALRKAHMRSTLSLRSFPNIAFETVPMFVWLTLALSRFSEGRSSSASSFNASLFLVINGVISLALCPQVVSQASQHFRSYVHRNHKAHLEGHLNFHTAPELQRFCMHMDGNVLQSGKPDWASSPLVENNLLTRMSIKIHKANENDTEGENPDKDDRKCPTASLRAIIM